MDVFYEESAVNANSAKGEKRYKLLNVFTKLLGALSLVSLIFSFWFVFSLIFGDPQADEELQEAYATVQAFAVLSVSNLIFWGGCWLVLRSLKKRVNISYDYIFVSGELRIAKIFNVNRRKFLYRIASEDILQTGDVDSDGYVRLKADPTIKEVVCTSNAEASAGKFFLYVYAVDGAGRKLFILECRETLLVNILKFVKRGTLAPDYIAQEKKNKQR